MELLVQNRELIWGVYARCHGLLLFYLFNVLRQQVLQVHGERGLISWKKQRDRLVRYNSKWSLLTKRPSLFNYIYSDTWILGFTWVAMLLSAYYVYGGPGSWYALFGSWFLLHSYQGVLGVMFPWDALLSETTFTLLFLPNLAQLPDLRMKRSPEPQLCWLYAWSLFRLMFGFGKFTFLGKKAKDSCYIQTFLVYLPIPSFAGWVMAHAPLLAHQGALLFMFISEIIFPFFFFFSGPLRVIGSIGTIVLQIGIHFTGNFGYFNVLSGILSITMLDPVFTIFDADFISMNQIIVNLYFIHMLFGGLVQLPFNYWVAQSWMWWPDFHEINRSLVVSYYKALYPLRTVFSYGIFPPAAGGPIRYYINLEGSNDGNNWIQYKYKYYPCTERSFPPFLAPYHPRLDQGLLYETLGTSNSSFQASLFSNTGNLASKSLTSIIIQKIFEGDWNVSEVFQNNPFPEKPPKYIRARLFAMRLNSLVDGIYHGKYWQVKEVGQCLPEPVLERDSSIKNSSLFWKQALPPPELQHPDSFSHLSDDVYILRELKARASVGRYDILQLTKDDTDIKESDIFLFWNKFVPIVGKYANDILKISELRSEVQSTFDGEQLFKFHRILGRLTALFMFRVEGDYYSKKIPKNIPTYFHLSLASHYIISKGETEFMSVFNDKVYEKLSGMRSENGWILNFLFYQETMMLHYRSSNISLKTSMLLDDATYENLPPILPGFSKELLWIANQDHLFPKLNVPIMKKPLPWGSWSFDESYWSN